MTSSPSPQHWKQLPHAPSPGTALGRFDDLADGQARLVDLDTSQGVAPPFRLVLVRSGDHVRAFVNRCAHFGVPLAQRQDQLLFTPHQRLTCNVHYARYHWDDGRCLSGECAGEGLLAVPLVRDAEGHLRIGETI